ncbi:hypothetical protein M405DRAFT_407779 [Rhizopogon salebrosus TDB-379]|nr:hypothetical protein M405DRAFT_407779 [Rhizopogon salebrosus TDB-379]
MAGYTCGTQGGQDVTTRGRGYRDAVSSGASQEVSPPRKNVYVPSDTHYKVASSRRRDEQYDPRVVEEWRVADIRVGQTCTTLEMIDQYHYIPLSYEGDLAIAS